MTDACADPEPEKLPMPAEGSRLTAAFIATKLRDVDPMRGCQLEPVGTVVRAQARPYHRRPRSRVFDGISAWSYLGRGSRLTWAWGGMDMTGLRMISVRYGDS